MLIIIFSLSAIFGTATNKEYKKLVKENHECSVSKSYYKRCSKK